MAGKPIRKLSREDRLALEDRLFEATAKEENVAREKARANRLRLRALRLAKEAADIEADSPATQRQPALRVKWKGEKS